MGDAMKEDVAKKRGLGCYAACNECDYHMERMNHILIECTKARQAWGILDSVLKNYTKIQCLKELFPKWSTGGGKQGLYNRFVQ